MIYALIISIALNIIEGIFLFVLLKQYKAVKKKNTVLAGNIIELKKYYDEYTNNILQHIKDENGRQGVTDNEAKQHILDIINDNNAAAAKLRNNK